MYSWLIILFGLRGFLALIESDLDYDLYIINIEKKWSFKPGFEMQ